MKGASFLSGVVTLCFCLSAQAQDGLIISELMDATLPGGLPKFVELTNCGDTTVDLSGFSIGNINNGDATMGFDALVLSGTLEPGESYVVSYENGDGPGMGVFFDTYGFDPDNFEQGSFINGDDVIVLFIGPAFGDNSQGEGNGDPGDGSVAPVQDVYGVPGVDGTGEVWEYTDGYSYRYGGASPTNVFDPAEWFFGGADSLQDPGGDDAVELELILTSTDPGTHICAAMVINEIHADPAPDLPGDANGDGVRDSSDDEFVEIYNNTGGDLDISGWELADGFGVRHEFPGGTIVGGACAVVVFGGGTPTGVFGGAVVQTATTGALGLNNGGDTVTLSDGGGNTVAQVIYGGEGGDNQSLTRDPDVFGDFVKHTDAVGSGGTLYSPGTMVDGSPFPGCFVPVTGACCDETTGICTEGVTQEDCEASGGTYGGDDTTCDDIVCLPPPTGACCVAGFCADDLTQLACEGAGGVYQGDDSTCAGVDCGPAPDVQINELRLDQPGGDNDEYFELVGAPGTSLDGLTYIVIGDGSGGDGTIEAVIPLTGSTIPDDGHFFAAEDDDTLGEVADLITTLNFENSDNVTHVLVAGFLGQNGDDVDPEDDCVQTVFPYVGELDRIALIEEENPPADTECHYGPPTVGPDGTFVPGQAYRCYPTGEWTIGGFTLGTNDTPGMANFTCGDALALDFRPGSCPNPLNRTSNGVLPMGLLGTGAFDVSEVDISSLALSRADGEGGSVAPIEGPPGPHTVLEDVGTPFGGELCDCHELGGDGITDVSMKFRTQDTVEALLLDDLANGEVFELVLTGQLLNGSPFTVSDCAMIVPPGSGEPVSVASNVANLFVDVTPLDDTEDASGFTQFTRFYQAGTTVTLTAPGIVSSNADSRFIRTNGTYFHHWNVDGIAQPIGQQTIVITPADYMTVEAVYVNHRHRVVPGSAARGDDSF